MPVWHAQLEPYFASGAVKVVGLIQEQHAERCRLFAQWQGFEWPILHDPINLLGPRAVPLFIAIDEHGIVQSTRADPDWFIETFLQTDYPAPDESAPAVVTTKPNLQELRQSAERSKNAADWLRLGDAEMLWGDPGPAVDAYSHAVATDPMNAPAHFRLGVAQRMRFDSADRQPDDFRDAVASWGRALEIDPNHYIYRRRIQQYGPRLIKPYSFYDWVTEARREIAARGETPIQLAVEPSGAEFAEPSRERVAGAADQEEPDPDGRITRDVAKLITVSSVVVPDKVAAGEALRVHVELQPALTAHWNNEAEPVVVWVNSTRSLALSEQRFELPQPAQPESRETRRLEFEIQTSDAAEVGEHRLSAHALYYVCEEAGGQCLYLRRDFEIVVRVGGMSRP